MDGFFIVDSVVWSGPDEQSPMCNGGTGRFGITLTESGYQFVEQDGLMKCDGVVCPIMM